MVKQPSRHQLVTSLFSGIGGFELGLSAAGHKAALFCEIDPEATAVLRRRFPRIPVLSDVRDVEALVQAIPASSQLLTAGFPCTDLSQAGRTLGFDGKHSSLIRDVFRLLDRRPFESILIENVPNWRVLHRGAYFREVLDALEDRGYRWAYRTIDVRAFGLPQRRQRIFLYASRIRDPRFALFNGNCAEPNAFFALKRAAHGFYWTEGSRGLGWGEDCVPTLKGGSTVGIPSPPAIVMPNGTLVTPHICDAERMQGFPAGWTDIKLVHEGQKRRPFRQRRRWMLVGNAVNVEVAAWIGRNLMLPSTEPSIESSKIRAQDSMPPCAWSDGEVRYSCELSAWPMLKKSIGLRAFLEHPTEPLSLRATKGFLRRANASSLRFAEGFLAAVENHVAEMEESATPSLRLNFKQSRSTIAAA